MLVKTPQQVIKERGIIPANYIPNLYCLFDEMMSDGSMQDDVGGVRYTPNNTFTVNGDHTVKLSDSAAIATDYPTTNKTIAATTDLVSFLVASRTLTGSSDLTAFNFGKGAGSGIVNRQADDGTGALIHDGVASLNATAAMTPAATGDYILSVAVLDRDVGVFGYYYNLTTASVIGDNSSAGTLSNSLVPGSFIKIANCEKLLQAGIFTFPSNGLPATWKADMVTLGNAAVAARG